MFLRREMMDTLLAWKKRNAKSALMICGARQTGKTTIVEEFARNEYEHFVEINFLESQDAGLIFESTKNAEQILLNIQAYTGAVMIEHKTLILFDEIQECPKARTAIKFLVQNGKYDYIETGSLLGVNLEEIRSYPVGFEEIVNLSLRQSTTPDLPDQTWVNARVFLFSTPRNQSSLKS